MVGEIEIHGDIGGRVTLESVKKQIEKYPTATSWNVYLSSEGGDVYEGIEMYHQINALPNVTVIVEGLCASIATLVMQAGQKIIALRPSDFMIHNPWGTAEGESKDFKAAAAQLDRAKSTIMSVLKKRLKGTDQQIAEMMNVQTWMNADEAQAAGLIDEVQDRLKAVAKFDYKKFDMETITKKEAEGMFEKFGKKLDDLKNLFKIKDAIPMTLADGTAVVIDTDNDQDIAGKNITMADGSPLPDGPYQLADGRQITVTAGVIAETEVEAKADPMKQENEALKQKVAQLEADLAAKNTAEAATNKALLEVKNQFKGLQSDFETFKNMTVGDTTIPGSKPEAEAERQKVREKIQKDPMLAAFAEHASGLFGDNLKKQ